jgi:group I intron endonuclease
LTEKPGIYQIRNLANAKVYVGSATNISKRWSRHKADLRLGSHSNKHLQASWLKYGEASFVFEILELTDALTVREQAWIDATKCTSRSFGYNKCPVARSSRGRVTSDTARQHQSEGLRRVWKERPWVFAKRSHAVTRSILNAEIASRIRNEYGQKTGNRKPRGGVTYESLAKKYGVHPMTVYDIVAFKTWKEVPSGS